MTFTLKGDYFNGTFTHENGVSEEDLKLSSEKLIKYCPADKENSLWEALIDYNNVSKVVDSATKGFETWRKTSMEERVEKLEKFKEIAEEKASQIAHAIAMETGKPLWESETEASAIAAKVNVTLSDSKKRIEQQKIENVLPKIDGHIIKKPLGVSLVIGPFNFPCHLANGQILSALLSGNSIIFKPSEKTIYSGQLLIECFHEAGLPVGVVNMINGSAHTTQSLIKSSEVKGIFFTGSLEVGKKILESVGSDLTKLVALELGGKNVTIIHKDADIDHAIAELIRSCFLSSGQRCTSTSLIAIHRDIEKEVIDKFVDITRRLIIGHPVEHDEKPFMGPLIDEAALNKYNQFLESAQTNGAKELLGPKDFDLPSNGHYASPTIHYLDEAQKDNPFTQTEVFGPNCCFTPFEDIDDAIRIANISDYGLAASIFTQDKEVYKRCLRDIDAGLINLNRSTVGASSRLPFGGVKNSGNFHPAAVSMIDHTVTTVSSLETLDNSSTLDGMVGLK